MKTENGHRNGAQPRPLSRQPIPPFLFFGKLQEATLTNEALASFNNLFLFPPSSFFLSSSPSSPSPLFIILPLLITTNWLVPHPLDTATISSSTVVSSSLILFPFVSPVMGQNWRFANDGHSWQSAVAGQVGSSRSTCQCCVASPRLLRIMKLNLLPLFYPHHAVIVHFTPAVVPQARFSIFFLFVCTDLNRPVK